MHLGEKVPDRFSFSRCFSSHIKSLMKHSVHNFKVLIYDIGVRCEMHFVVGIYFKILSGRGFLVLN